MYNGQWCEAETVTTQVVWDNKPFQMWASSCCWIPTVYYGWGHPWTLSTLVDLGERSDTKQPNRSPEIAILPFLRVPQNCPRTYRLMSFDPDGDKVRCRYGNPGSQECAGCTQHPGFHLDQDSCTLHYQNTNADPSVRSFEIVVEDFPRGHISLNYTDGSRSYRSPLSARRRKRQVTNPWYAQTTIAGWGYPGTTAAPRTTTTQGTTAAPRTTTTQGTTAAPRTTTTQGTTPAPRTTTTQGTTAAPRTTTTEVTTTIPWWWTTRIPLQATTSPLSKLPLQFSFLVDPPVPSCQEGLYLPMFVHPTPANGEQIHAEVNKEVEIRIKAQASYAAIQDIIISGPMNMTKHRTTHDEFVLRWTPLSSDLGDYFPVCFAVESATGSAATSSLGYTHSHSHFATPTSQSGVYQSEMRCVVLQVGKKEIKTNVICTESTMTVEVEKSSFNGLHENHLRLSESSNTLCSLERYSNSTHIIGVIPLNACGTQIEEDAENLIFKNEITTVDDSRDLITRKHHLEVEFYCQYPKKGNVSLGFTAHRKSVEVWDKGFGKFTYQFEFYPNNQFQNMIDPNSYPLEYDVGQKIYMEIDASTMVNDTEIFVESCRASPYDNPNYHPIYSIIEDGCPVDPTVMVHATDNKRQFRFCIEAFKFIGLYDQVYISCSVIMCKAGDPNTRCSQGCINSTSNDHHHVRKRDAAFQTAQHFISQGPLRLKRSADISSTAGNNLNLNLNLVFIAGCLLVAVGMICGVAMYRSKMSKVKYQPLPSCES
ncbi:CUB and zona pellucida-like domain-containing protein 1 isoform X2 [Archocentrus centrarchus]|uniref:CUB and zona pellucida-like domain-containing protein 1 isoform X2 n=1 Tax=Archocentrus centrarchus TaxID=63155 RepID=UPI0011EA26C1|nr:CUB and zona pellucida-like domain-containing protein 1 isoform X2 [Archocentrus centrarchus]